MKLIPHEHLERAMVGDLARLARFAGVDHERRGDETWMAYRERLVQEVMRVEEHLDRQEARDKVARVFQASSPVSSHLIERPGDESQR